MTIFKECNQIAPAFFSSLQKTDRILSEDNKIEVKQSIGTLACTNTLTGEIFLDSARIASTINAKTLDEFIPAAKGLNYHELAHNLFTDYNLDMLIKFLRKETISVSSFHDILNTVEDGRIENLFVENYPNSENYFLYCLNNIILKQMTKVSPTLYASLYSRKYVDCAIIKNLRNILSKTASEETIVKIESLVNGYILEQDTIKRLNYALKLYRILIDSYNQDLSDNKDLSVDNSPNMANATDSKQREKEKENKKNRAKNNKESLAKFKKTQESKKENDQEKTQDNNQDNNQDNKMPVKARLKMITESIKSNLENNEQFKKEIIQAIEQSQNIDGINSLSITPEMRMQSKSLAAVLKRLSGDYAKQPIFYKSSGKLSLKCFMHAKKLNNTNMFIRQNKSKLDKTKINASIIIDSSGSMHDEEHAQELKCSWILTNALESLKNNVEVIEFSTDINQLKSFKAKTGNFKRTMSGRTRIVPAVNLAIKNHLELRKKENKNSYVIILSDGIFDDCDSDLYKMNKQLKNNNIKTIWIYVNKDINRNVEINQTKFNHFLHVTDFKLLASKLQTIITRMQKEINENSLARRF